MDGTLQGRSSFELKCQETGVYSLVPPVLSVDCGASPRRNHSTVDPTGKVHTEKADYLCDVRYIAVCSSTVREARCRWNGTFSVQLVVRTGTMAFVDRTACLKTKRHQRAVIWVTTRAIATLVYVSTGRQARLPVDTWTSDEKGGMQAPFPGEPFDVGGSGARRGRGQWSVQGKNTLQIVSE